MSQTPPTPTPTSATFPAGPPSQGDQDPAKALRPRSLNQGVLPRWFLPAVLAGAVVLGAAVSSLIGFNIALWFIFSALFYLAGAFVLTLLQTNRRKAVDVLWKNLVYTAFVVALIPLVSVIWSVTSTGFSGLTNPGFFTEDMQSVRSSEEQRIHDGESPMSGGVYHAIVGSMLITVAATVISVPIGMLTSIYLVEYSRGGPLSRGITFFVDVMTGIPSIVAGLFGAAAVQSILSIGNSMGLWSMGAADYRMGITAAIALSVLMIPVVVRTTEEMLRVVPNELREASYALGVRKWRTILKVVIPTAISGIAAGVTLAIARVIGETAPILLTAGMLNRVNWDMFGEWMMTLPVYIYWTFTHPAAPAELAYLSHERAWGAALVLIIIVMALNLIARIIATIFAPKKTGR